MCSVVCVLLYVLAKGMYWDEATLNGEEIKSVDHCQVMRNQPDGQSVRIKYC